MAWTPLGLLLHDGGPSSTEEISMRTTFGLDIAKRVFQLHTVDPDMGEIAY
jgi:hypothetical protein